MIAEDLGPALNKVITDDLKPAIGDMLGPQTNQAIGGLVRQITKDAVLGANDGMSELGISLSPNRADGLGIFGWAALVLGLIVAILLIWLGRTIYTRRSLEKERARSERMLLNVLRTIQYTDTDDPKRPPDLDALLARARMNDDPDPASDAWLNSLVARARADKAAAPPGPPAALLSPPRTLRDNSCSAAPSHRSQIACATSPICDDRPSRHRPHPAHSVSVQQSSCSTSHDLQPQ
jgi:hypothetical protein